MHLKAFNDSLTKIEKFQESTTDLMLSLVPCDISHMWYLGWGLSVISAHLHTGQTVAFSSMLLSVKIGLCLIGAQ